MPFDYLDAPSAAPEGSGKFDYLDEGPSVGGFGENLMKDIKGNVSGLASLGQGLVEHPIDTAGAVAKGIIPGVIGEGKRLGVGELLTGHPINAAEKFGQAAYDKPLTTALDVLPFAGEGAKALGIGGEAAEAGKAGEMAAQAGKELPIIEAGAKTGEPHALFAYNDKFGPGGAERSVYNVFGDVEHPAVKGVGWGSSIPAEDLEKAGIPITGRQPGSEKFTPISAPTPEQPTSVMQRLKAKTTAGALDINPMALRKQAMKAGMTPEQYTIQLGQQAEDAIPGLVKPMDSANAKFGKVFDAHDASGKAIGDIVDAVTKETGTGEAIPETTQTIADLRNAAANYYQVDGGENALLKTADRLEELQKAGKLDFDRLHQVKSAIGKGFNKTDTPPGTEEIYDVLNKNIDNIVNRVDAQNPAMHDQLAQAKKVYTVTSRLIPAMARTAAREVAGATTGGGVMSKLLPSLIGGAVGGPAGVVGGAGAKFIQEAVAPDLLKNLGYMGMKATPQMIAAVKKAIPNLGQAEAAAVANNLMQLSQKKKMAHGGVVPHKELNDFVAQRYGK